MLVLQVRDGTRWSVLNTRYYDPNDEDSIFEARNQLLVLQDFWSTIMPPNVAFRIRIRKAT